MADQDLTFAGLGYDLSTPAAIGADASFLTPRSWNTVPTDALESMTPVTPNASGEWSGFFRDLTKTIVGYSIVKDAQQSGVQPAANVQPGGAVAPRTTQPSANLVPLLLIGAAVFAVVKLAQ